MLLGCRAGVSLLWLLLVIVVIGTIATVLFYSSYSRNADQKDQHFDLYTVQPEIFEHKVIEPGEVEASNYTEIRCEVQSRNSSGIMILEIIPNGKEVDVGTMLIKFDSSALENERNQQQIACNNSAATLAQSKAGYETACISKDEYIFGTFVQDQNLIQSEVFVAEENLRRGTKSTLATANA